MVVCSTSIRYPFLSRIFNDAPRGRFTNMTNIKVVIADDNTVVRKVIRRFLDRHPRIDVVGEARDGLEALACVQRYAPDVLLLDMEMPGLNGLGVVKKLRADNSSVRVLVLSAYTDPHFINGVLDHGAAGYLTKDESPERIVEAVQQVANGETAVYSERVIRKLNG